MTQPQPTNKKEQVNEILKCGKNPVYFIKNFIKIQHPKKGLIPFDTYGFQDDCIKSFQEERFNIVLKSRQLGLSTVTAAYAVWMAIFHKDKNILVIATKLNTAINFIKKVKVMIDSLPKWLLLTKYEPTKQHVRFSNGSSISAIPTSPDAGRSEALSLLIVDEAAFIRDFEDIWTGLYPTLTTGGSAIIISTPNGVGGQYYKLWTDATSHQNEFNTIYLPWHVHPEHDQEWFDKETRNLPKRKISQEYLCLAKGTKIITRDGYKKIEEIAVGDEVLTHKGRFKKILKTHSRKVEENETLWEVSCPGNRSNPLLITGDHPSLAYRFWKNGGSHFAPLKESNMEPDWIPVKEIGSKRKNTDKILNCLFPVIQNSIATGDLCSVDLTKLGIKSTEEDLDKCRYFKQWRHNARNIPVDYNLGKLVGLYLAEGCKSHCGGLDLGFHANEWNTHVEWVLKYLESFGCRVKRSKTKGTNGCRVWSYNKYFGALVRFFVKGEYAPQKSLNMEALLKTNTEFIRGVLEGHYLGDGNHNHDKKFCVYSTSEQLVYQLRTLYSLFSLHPRIGVCKQAHKNPVHHDVFYLEFFANGRSYSDLISNGQTELIGSKIVRHDKYFVGKVNLVDKSSMISDGVTVYDIKVEDDASFVAESLILHNCDFISSGENFLQSEEMDYLRSLIVQPIRKEGIANCVWIWKNPVQGHLYAISADVSRGDAFDFSTFHVIDVNEKEIVAEFKGKVPPDKLADILIEYGLKYNNALICPEKNTFGYFTCVKLRDSKYKRLWYKSTYGDPWNYTPRDPEEVPGFDTQTNSRSQILGKLEELIRNKEIKIYSQRLYGEFQAFYWNGSKAQAMKDSHDDLVMSLAIGLWVAIVDSRANDNYQEVAKAMLASTRVVRVNYEFAPMPQVSQIKTSYEAEKARRTYLKPQDGVNHPKIISDLNWLLR